MTDRIISLDAAISVVMEYFPSNTINDPKYAAGKAFVEALSALPAVDGWLDIEGIPDAQQVEVLMQDCECGQFLMLATLYNRDAPMSFVNEDGDYFPPYQNGCWPTHFRIKTWPLPTPPEIE